MAAGVHGTEVRTVVSTADATLKASHGHIHWISISNTHATDATNVELENGSGVDVWGVQVEAIDTNQPPVHFLFDPPILCDTDIRVDITGGTVKVTVGIT